ncbi:DUF2510 domain-containing protein [Nocardioides iriomotensis]|nr:DUF2510 domain-containing protein [Nocardioides iriomotensis]
MGWYADPEDPSAVRFWNGRSWDEPVAADASGHSPWPGGTTSVSEELMSPSEVRFDVGRPSSAETRPRSPQLLLVAAALAVTGTVGSLLAVQAVPLPCQELAALTEDASASQRTKPAVAAEHDRLLTACRRSGGSVPQGEYTWSGHPALRPPSIARPYPPPEPGV